METLSQETIATIVAGVVIAGFLWNLHRDVASLHRDMAGLHRDMAGLRDRVSRLEGLFEGLRDSVNRLERRFDERFPPAPAADD